MNSGKQSKSKDKYRGLGHRAPTQIEPQHDTVEGQPFRSQQQMQKEQSLTGTGKIGVSGSRLKKLDNLMPRPENNENNCIPNLILTQQFQQSQDLSTIVHRANKRNDLADNNRSKGFSSVLDINDHSEDRKLHQKKNKLRHKEIIGRRVDAPSIVVAQGVRDEIESLEQGYIAQNQRDKSSPNNGQSLYEQVRLGIGKTAGQRVSQSKDAKRATKSSENVRGQRRPQTSHGTVQAAKNVQKQSQQPMKKTKQISMIEFLDSSLQERAGNSSIQNINRPETQQQTLNILTATVDQFAHASRQKSSTKQAKSVAAKTQSDNKNIQDRNLIQTKYLNFQREVTAKKRGKSAESNNRQKKSKPIITKAQNPFQQINKNNKTIEVENRAHRKRMERASSGSPDKSRSSGNFRGKSGDSSHKQRNVGASSSYSPRSRSGRAGATQFAEARTLLVEQRSTQMSVESRKKQLKNAELVKGQNQQQAKFQRQQAATQMANHSSTGLVGVLRRAAGKADHNNQSVEFAPNVSDNLRTINDGKALNRSHDNIGSAANYIVSSSKMLNGSLKRIVADQGISCNNQSVSPSAAAGRETQATLNPRPGTQMTQISNFRPGDNKIDKIILDNLKKEKQKSLQRKIKEKEDEQNSKKRKIELEQANDRVRKQNKQKVKRRQQQQFLLQTNAIIEAADDVDGPGQSKGNQTMNLEQNFQNMLARNEKLPNGELSNEMSMLLESVNNQRAKGQDGMYKREDKVAQLPLSALETKQQAARTQKLEMKFNSNNKLDEMNIAETSQLLGRVHKKLGRIENMKQRESQGKVEKLQQDENVKRFKDQRRSYGLEFIDIRKEIITELKQIGQRLNISQGKIGKRKKEKSNNRDEKNKTEIMDTSALLNLRASKSQRQALVKTQDEEEYNEEEDIRRQYLKGAIFMVNNSREQLTAAEKQQRAQDRIHQSMTSGPILKKERIRKFMKEKQKQFINEQEKNKQTEIQKTLKVHANLLKLDKYAKKKLKTVHGTMMTGQNTTKAAGTLPVSLRHPRNLNTNYNQRKNVTLAHEQSQLEGNTSVNPAQNLTITPNKMIFEVSEPSFVVSAKPSRKLNREHRRSQSREMVNNSQDEQRNRSIQMSTIEDNKQQPRSSQEQADRLYQQQVRHERLQVQRELANRSEQGLAPLFENSNSAKTLQRQLREVQKAAQTPHGQQTKKQGDQSRSIISKATPLRSSKAPPKNLKVSKKTASKQKKRGKSIGKTVVNQQQQQKRESQQNKVDIKVPDSYVPGTKKKFDRMSIQTLKGLQNDESLLTSQVNQSSLVGQYKQERRMSKENAAQVIQKEVRKFLKTLGFYEAREVSSPEREPQISLFIEKRQKSKQASHMASPEQLRDPKETTVIAELSGFKKDDIIGNISCGEQSSRGSARHGLDHDINNLEQEFMQKHAQRLVENQHMQGIWNPLVAQQMTESSPFQDELSQRDQSVKSPPKPSQRPSQRSSKGKRQQSSSSEREKLSRKQKQRKSSKIQANGASRPEKHLRPMHHGGLQQQNTDPGEYHRQKLSDAYRVELENGESNLNHLTRHAAQIQQETKSVQTPSSKRKSLPMEKTSSKSASVVGISPSASNFEIHQVQLSVESKPSIDAPMTMNNFEVASQSSSSMFDRNAFQQFSQKKLSVIMKNNEYSKLIKFREEMLKFRERREKKIIKKQLNQNQVSPRTYKTKKQQIDRWVQVEKQEIERTKTTFQEEWDKTVQMIEDTQKNMDQMKTKMGVGISGSASAASIQKQQLTNGSAHKPSINQFNSQSCQSLSSHRNYNNGFNIGVGGSGLNNILGSVDHQRSILIEDPPKSYRSGRQEMPIVPMLPAPAEPEDQALNSMGVLSSRRSGNNGQPEKIAVAQNLLQYMEKRLANHKEQSATSLSEFKNRGSIENGEVESITQPQLMTDQKGNQLESESKLGSMRRISNGESEGSHQPSAEFVERLEKATRNELDNGGRDLDKELFELDGPLPPSIVSANVSDDPASIMIQENQFNEKNLKDEAELLEKENQGNFKNQVISIKDFGLLDSERTSKVSEMSLDKDLENLIVQKSKVPERGSLADELASPSAEHLEEPSIVASRETEQPDEGQSIRISQMLKGQEPQELKQEKRGPESDDFLQEPAIISSSLSLETGDSNPAFANDSNLLAAKIKPFTSKDTKEMLKDPAGRKKLVEQLTEELLSSIVDDCALVKPRSKLPLGHTEESQKQNHDVYYIDQLQSEKEERKEWIELRQRHLIENDLIRIDQYINEIVDALLQFEIDFSSDDDSQSEARKEKLKPHKDDNYHVQFLKQLTQPIQKESTTTLQNLQTSEIGSYKHFETTQDLQKYPIIPVDLYLEIEKAREEAMIARKGANTSKQTQLVWESIHIQNKGFFDAVNESLMKFRPYGLTGEPMPWSNKVRRLQTKVEISSVDTERLFQMVKQEVFRWGQTFCGCLPSPVFCFPAQSQTTNSIEEKFNDELFQENREKRLTQILSAETVEQEHHWLNYEYEEAQVKIDLSDMILEHLVDELVTLLNKPARMPRSHVSSISYSGNEQVTELA